MQPRAEFNAAIGKVFNPSDKKGGTLKMANSGDWDSLDPGDTYYGYSWNFGRIYGRTLVMFKPAPGEREQRARPRPGRGPGQAHRRRQDLDLQDPSRA